MMKEQKDLWFRISSELAGKIGVEPYNLWACYAKPVRMDDHEIMVAFPDTYLKEKLSTGYRRPFEESVRKITNRNTRVMFMVDAALFHITRSSTPSPLPSSSPPSLAATGMTFENFILGPANRHAFNAARYFVDHPRNLVMCLLIHGPSGVGKTHLLNSIRYYLHQRHPKTNIQMIDAGTFYRQYVHAVRYSRMDGFRHLCRKADILLFDDLHALGNKLETQKELMHTLLSLQGTHRKIVLTCDSSLKNLKGFVPIFPARVLPDMEIHIDRPDIETRLAILEKHARHAVPVESLRWLAGAIEGNLKDLLNCLDQVVRSGRKTLEETQRIATAFRNTWHRHPSIEDIARRVASHYGVKLSEIYSPSRKKEIALARQACYYLAKTLLHASFEEIGRHFGDRDHTTVMSGLRRISTMPAEAKRLKNIAGEINTQPLELV